MKLLRQFSHSSLLVTLLTLTIPLSSAFPEFAAQYDSEHDIEGREQLGSDKEATTTAGPPTVPTPPPNYPPHKPGRWGPFNPRNPTSGWQPLVINETINYYEYHKHGDQNGKYVRSMCPALNTLANRGFINRTGKKLDYISLVRKAKEVFNFGEDNGLIVVEPMFALHNYPKTIDLDQFGDQLTQHYINCPAAPTREDREIGDNINLNPKYYAELLSFSRDGETFSLDDFARHHHLRHNQSLAQNPKFRFGSRDAICSLAQYSNLVGILGRIGKHGLQTVYLEDLRYFYEKEDLPPKWKRREWGYYIIEAQTYIDRMANYIGFQPVRPFPSNDNDPGIDVEPVVADYEKPCGSEGEGSVWARTYFSGNTKPQQAGKKEL